MIANLSKYKKKSTFDSIFAEATNHFRSKEREKDKEKDKNFETVTEKEVL